jgi:hypothetical protein
MKTQSIAFYLAATFCLSACIVAPPHTRYVQQQSVVSVQTAPVYAPAPAPIYAPAPAPVYVQPPVVYVQPAPQVYYNPWLVPNIGLNFWWGRQWGGHGHRH